MLSEWKPCFWVIVNHRLWIYRSKADYNPMDYLHVRPHSRTRTPLSWAGFSLLAVQTHRQQDPFSERIKKSFHLRDSMRVSDIKGKVRSRFPCSSYCMAAKGPQQTYSVLGGCCPQVYPGESRTLYTFGIDYIEEDGGKE